MFEPKVVLSGSDRSISPFSLLGSKCNFANSSARLRPLSERLLKPPPQLICLTLRKLPEVLFKLSLQLVPGAFHLKLVHGSLDI